MDNAFPRAAIRKIIGPLLILGSGIAIAFTLSAYVKGDIERDARLQFERQAADAKHIIERRLRAYVGVTYGLRALFAANDSLSRAEFHRYVASLDLSRNYPGFVQLNYARHITASEKRQFEEAVRADASLDARGYPRFAIKPPAEHAEYHVLVYIEPMLGNEFSFGLDIGTTGVPGKAINRLRDTG